MGTAIPKAAPWVHFGDGKSVIDMQLPPGPHKLTLQIGDDLHRTMTGLCQTINVTVNGDDLHVRIGARNALER